MANKIPKNGGGYFYGYMISTRKMGRRIMVRINIMSSKPQAYSIILAVFLAIFLHNSLKLFLTGSNQAFDNVKGGEPNAAVGKK